MTAPTIIKGSDHFFVTTYEGNGGGQKVGKFIPFTDNGTIAKSCIFENGGPAYLDKTYGSAGTSLKKFTFSCWFKIGFDTIAGTSGYFPTLFNVGGESGKYFSLFFQSQYHNIQLYSYNSGYDLRKITNRTFEDTTKWYHIVCAIDTTESTGSDRVKLYIDGDRITSFSTSVDPSQDYDLSVGAAEPYYVGFMNSGDTWDGYMAEVNYVDGTALTPSTFGLTDTSTGRWIPKTLTGITYGSNGFRMQFANSAGQTIGDDTSGNGNDFTVNNIATTDLTTDSPTQNFATAFHNQSDNGTLTMSEGNLKIVQGTNTSKMGSGRSTLILDPNDPNLYYCEYKVDLEHGGNGSVVGFSDIRADGKKADSSDLRMDIGTNYFFACDTYIVHEIDGADAGTGNNATLNPEFTTNDVMGLAFQAGKIWIAKNNTWSNSGNPGAGTGHLVELSKNTKYRFYSGQYGSSSGNQGTFNFGQKSFNYTPPSGAVNLQQDNLLTTGKGVPDVVWIKNRDQADAHQWYDSTRGPLLDLQTDSTNTESTTNDGLQKFLQNGFAVEDDVSINSVAESYVAFNWVAGGGTTSANSDGSGASIASTIQKNETAGFSVVSYSGSGTGSTVAGTVAHGLSKTPQCIWIKSRTAGNNWVVYHHKISDPSDKVLYLNDTNAETNWPYMGDTDPTNKVFTISSDLETGRASNTYMAYCWYGIEGFSKFGTYEGNNSADGAFVYLGFKPALLIVKNLDGAYGWRMYDNVRAPINPIHNTILADVTTAENTSTYEADFLANGFKQRDTYSSTNASNSYVYMAWAEHPFVGSGTNPVTAR